jgi:NAD(P)-dependent dehydrogenase (short-subunit alcohol dehydrogenase family)
VPSSQWTAADLPDQTGRTFLITGGNSGVGFEAARILAGAGGEVILAVRDTAKGERAAAEIPGGAEVRRLDLASLDSVREFAGDTRQPFEVLINNAGVMAVPLSRTVEGFEMQFGVNHLGHFALTNLLLAKIGDRVVTVSSGAHRMGRINLADLNWERRRYLRWNAYSQSKLANLLFTLELERRLVTTGSRIRALAAHPGYAATNLQSHYGNPVMDRLMGLGNRIFAQSAEMGALPIVYAATQDLPGGSYVGPNGRSEKRGHPTLVGRSTQARDVVMAERLWQESEQLTGVRFPDSLTPPPDELPTATGP